VTIEPLDGHVGADDAGVRVLRATGELDIASVPAMLPLVSGLVDGARRVVLDLTSVTFFDSSGVRLVDRLLRECRRTGAPVRVVAPPGNRARRVLEVVGMAGTLVCDDVPSAVEATLA
jgi:anti-sigma B factor antagonist